MKNLKVVILVFNILLFFSCSEKQQSLAKSEIRPSPIEENYSSKIKHLKNFSKQNDYNKYVAFMIDYSLQSGKNRFFVVDLKHEKISKKALVCHGSCKNESKNNAACENFSNTSGSLCTSLGMAVIPERAYSKWGKNYKYWIDGLETSNSNMRKRVVVLHAWEHVPDKEIYPEPIVMSWGCPTVSIKFLDELDAILKNNKKVLLYSFN